MSPTPDQAIHVESPSSTRGEVLRRQLAALRRRYLAVRVIFGVGLVILALVVWAMTVMFFDWWLELPWGVRLVLLLAELSLVGFLVARFIVRPLWRQPDDDDLALLVERVRPAFRTRLIAAVQLSRPGILPAGASTALVEATVDEAERLARPLDFPALVETKKTRQSMGAAGGILAVAVVLFALNGATAFDLLKRALLSRTPVPRKTTVIVAEGNRIIGRGDDVHLEARALGIVPRRGTVEVRAPDRRTQSYPLEVDRSDRARFGRTLQNVQESFTYVIHLNDGRSQAYQVKVLPRPGVATIECRQEFPPYTGLGPVRRPLGDLALLAGSQLFVEARATKPLRSATLNLVGTNTVNPITMTLEKDEPTRMRGQLDIPAHGLSGFFISLVDQEGMSSKDAAVYRLEIVPDQVPQVRLTYPERKEELLTREARMIVGMEVSDDFALAQLRLRYTVDSRDVSVTNTLELDLAGEQPRRLQRQFQWNMTGFVPPLSEGTVIEYWLEAEDNNNVTGPGIGRSQRQLARIVSSNEKRADLLNRAGDAFAGISDAAADQELLSQRLGAIILEKTGPRR